MKEDSAEARDGRDAHELFAEHGKSTLRVIMRARRRAIEPAQRRELALAAATRLVASQPWKRALVVALYIAVRGELDTDPLLQAAWREGKQVLLPLCTGEAEAAVMRFIPCEGMEALRPGAYGIPEPPCPKHAAAEVPEPDLVIVPGLAFDKNGVRLGQGGGFYDRWFSRPEFAAALRIGYAYNMQLLDRLPREPWDMPVDAICTERGVLWAIKR